MITVTTSWCEMGRRDCEKSTWLSGQVSTVTPLYRIRFRTINYSIRCDTKSIGARSVSISANMCVELGCVVTIVDWLDWDIDCLLNC